MPGMKCPNCGQSTFYNDPKGKVCTKCGYTMIVPPTKNGKGPQSGGPGKKCSNCGKKTVFNNKCRSCGALYKQGEKS